MLADETLASPVIIWAVLHFDRDRNKRQKNALKHIIIMP